MKTPLNATCVSISGKAVLLFGESGSGKSDLALRLIDNGATLVGDDHILIHKDGNRLLASPAPNIHGIVEARGVGLMYLPYEQDVPVFLAVKLVPRESVERMPYPKFFDCIGLEVPLISLHAFDSSTPVKIKFHISSL